MSLLVAMVNFEGQCFVQVFRCLILCLGVGKGGDLYGPIMGSIILTDDLKKVGEYNQNL